MGRILAFKRASTNDKPIRRRIIPAVGREKLEQDRENRPSRKTREPWFLRDMGNLHPVPLASLDQSGGPQIIKIGQGQPLVDILTNLLISPSFLISCSKSEAMKIRRTIYEGNVALRHQIYTRYFPAERWLQLTRLK